MSICLSEPLQDKDRCVQKKSIMNDIRNVYFPNLNGVRFIAAMMVVVHHIEQTKRTFGYPSLYKDNIHGTNLGGLGVTLFFVLSGFLITYLLLEEKKTYGTIYLKQFYIRRILRIWPLYYLIIILSFWLAPNFFGEFMIFDFKQILYVDYYEKLFLYVFFAPNIAFITTYPVLFAAQAWSIGVEEQFYAIWPFLLKIFKRPIIIMLMIIVFFTVINFYMQKMIDSTGGYYKSNYRLYRDFFLVTRIDCMSVGGVFAYLAWSKNKITKYLEGYAFQLLVYIAVVVFSYRETVFYGFGHLPYSILFGAAIYNLAVNDKTLVSLENRLFDYGGKISYGIYMYQPIGIVITFVLYEKFFYAGSNIQNNIFLYLFSIIITLSISAISYCFFERYFLKKKVSFSKIVSGDNVEVSNSSR